MAMDGAVRVVWCASTLCLMIVHQHVAGEVDLTL